MKRHTWIKQHKWIGICVSLFLLMFSVTGILLNHRSLISNVSISRRWLPSRYQYHDWNGGLLRGSLALDDSTILIYGNSGCWLTDKKATTFRDFNDGMPTGADHRQIKRVVKTKDNQLFAVTPFALYRYGVHDEWHKVQVPIEDGETLADVEVKSDSLVVLSRDRIFISKSPYTHFNSMVLQASADSDRKVTLFSTVWLLHSGALFGIVGKLIADFIALCLIILCVTGITYWLVPRTRRTMFSWHNNVGRYTIILTILIAFTGWSLRPPMLALLASLKVGEIPGTAQSSDNPWHDKLRMIRYDEAQHDWLLSTTDGFYKIASLDKGESPIKVKDAPPANVMGLTVLQKDGKGRWLCGSMGGMLVWNRNGNTVTDYFTGKKPMAKKGSPVGEHAVIGYSGDFREPVIVDYVKGTTFTPQPRELSTLPMSLWNVALEIHSGRIYAGNLGSFLFIFLIGIFALWCLWSGYKLRLSKNTHF